MADYIEREAAYEKCGWYNTVNGKSVCAARKDELASIPTADVVPVVHGEWIIPTKIGHRSFNIPHCSACDGVPCGVDENTKFCPNCGADMRERREDG